jgi:hypothetical protein
LAVASVVVKITQVQMDYEEEELEGLAVEQVVQMVAVHQVLLRLAKEMQVLQIQVRPWAVAVVRAAQDLAKMVVWEQPTLLAALRILLREVAVAPRDQEQVEQAYQGEAQEAVILVVVVQAALQIQAEAVVGVATKEEAVAQAAQESLSLGTRQIL